MFEEWHTRVSELPHPSDGPSSKPQADEGRQEVHMGQLTGSAHNQSEKYVVVKFLGAGISTVNLVLHKRLRCGVGMVPLVKEILRPHRLAHA